MHRFFWIDPDANWDRRIRFFSFTWRKNGGMTTDIRDKAYISHHDVIGLNFIKPDGPYVFRRHFRQGLRSHVLELLLPGDIVIEKSGTVIDGTRWYPKAAPHRIFRIFRTRLKTLNHALEEVRRVKVVERYLLPEYLAQSIEIIVDYIGPCGRDLMLCGLQEYVQGEILDPWSPMPPDGLLPTLYDTLQIQSATPAMPIAPWILNARQKGARFVHRIKRMIAQTRHVPDLAGIGNLIMAASGAIKLVDINNIRKIPFDGTIDLDDRGYPVCDKSIEALSILEYKLLGRPIDRGEEIYRTFLEPRRMEQVRTRERAYHRNSK
jgi:hypothetical protein